MENSWIRFENMMIDKCAEIPTCNLVKMVYNKCLQQSNNKMTCIYEAIVNDLIRAFMQIANYRSWLKGDLLVNARIWRP